MTKPLNELLAEEIHRVESGEIGYRIVSYNDHKSKYVVLKPTVFAEVALTDGKVFKIDISDYFEGVIK